MRKNKVHILLSVFLLAVMLVGRVGLHIFHHHEFLSEHKHLSGLTISAEETEAADCALCKLDTFQIIAFEAHSLIVFFFAFVKPVYSFLLETVQQFSFFTKSRGPPVYLFSVA